MKLPFSSTCLPKWRTPTVVIVTMFIENRLAVSPDSSLPAEEAWPVIKTTGLMSESQARSQVSLDQKACVISSVIFPV